jgi:hypothetical protein
VQVKVSLEVVTLDVSIPLAVAPDGGATVLPTSMAVDFLHEIRRLVAVHRRAVPHLPAPRMAHELLTKSVTAVQMVGAAHHGVAC